MSRHLVLVAGGQGQRLRASRPKQFLQLQGRTLIEWALTPFVREGIDLAVVVLPCDANSQWKDRIMRCFPHTHFQFAQAGPQRFFSGQDGLDGGGDVDDSDLVAIHDAARPFLTATMLRRGWEVAKASGTAVPLIAPTDSVRIRQLHQWRTLPRETVRCVQTPQIFRWDILRRAYQQDYRAEFTDDATVVEAALFPLAYYEGDPLNFKVTTPADWHLAQAVALHKKSD